MTLPADTATDPAPTTFELRFTSTPRGARLARRLTAYCLDSWGHPYGSETNECASLVVAELAANAVTHGRVPGRDILLRLVRADGRLRIEVSDTRGERRPVTAPVAAGTEESGRGLLIVGALAETWGVTPRTGAPGKTVWAVLPTGAPDAPS
ncbi:ATP-binding protein [Streptomyces somaliensis]|uniref:ATP-binding protein n=1 Tax=Streptomyces somaliensis TaxID=78355 RepID=UPI0020CF4178|nr:ATP-binding protein [Streptomyces somaliensis]MCP9944740.1 ATP-binding protein [Streptomyces somaliensis]MCP9962036.1 ATP-binding protein [Streptomyces somaliensis]MCP9974854.1 ATP-binding protein [Streptomyces somaliensis]